MSMPIASSHRDKRTSSVSVTGKGMRQYQQGTTAVLLLSHAQSMGSCTHHSCWEYSCPLV